MLEARDVSFSYSRWRRRWVVSSFHWRVTPGAITLLLGPNGAGKSTLLKLLAGYDVPTSGTVLYQGKSDRDSLFAGVGWMPQAIRPARGLKAREQLEYAAWVAGSNRKEAVELARNALKLVRLADKAEIRSDQLSGGQLRRLGLAQACVRGGEVLLLDEPTAGLDPAQAINFRELLGTLGYPGGIVISTHQAADLADYVDRVAVLSQGTMLFDGSVEEFREHGREVGVASGNLADVFTSMIRGGMH